MKSYLTLVTRGVAAIAVASTLVAAGPAMSQPAAADPSTATAAHQDKMREHLRAHLDRMAKRLNIDASQQSAWNAYAAIVEGMVGSARQRPATDADAATIVRLRAEIAADHARKLSQLADATATLEQALNPQQRQTLAQIVRHSGRRHHGVGPEAQSG